MPYFEIAGLLALGAIVWLWYDGLKARDAGIRVVRAACQSEGLQLLDDTVAIASLRPARNDDGQLVLRRVYSFEYSDTGDNRRRGSVVLLGQRAIVLNMGVRAVPDGRMLH